MQGTCC